MSKGEVRVTVGTAQCGACGKEWLPRHPGGDPGFHTLLQLYPAHQRAIVILSNGETTPRAEIRDLIEEVLKSKPD